ncbi:alpha-isopropylmalate synthase regulatory domain-containing protein, partial [Microbacterium sp. zg.Y909]
DLVFTAFSGSHQDAIKKGFEAMEARAAASGVSVDEIEWAVPYLPIDPKDLGRSYEAVIRVNSQSGKGGVAYLLRTDHALDLPRKLQIEFSGVVQAKTDAEGGEVTSEQIWDIFTDEYLPSTADEAKWGRFELLATRTQSDMSGDVTLDVTLRDGDGQEDLTGTGNGPIAAFLSVLSARGFDISLYDYVEHTLSAGGDAQAAAYVELQVDGERLWGVGIDGDISTASLKAIVSCVNRAIRTRTREAQLTAV